MKILRAWYESVAGYPILRIKLEGFELTARIDGEAYRHLVGRNWGCVFLGPAFSDLLPEIERGGLPLQGFTADPEIIKLAEKFIADTRGSTFEAGKILIEEDQLPQAR